ncbi:MAG: MFS transporter, partial [Lachnospirales bacterium]
MNIHKKVFLCYILGQIACGYALGIAGTGFSAAVEPLGLNSFWLGLLNAGTLIGLSTSIIMGGIADSLGRKKLFKIDMILFTVLSFLQFFTYILCIILLLRIGIGACIAIDYTVGSSLLSEWYPDKKSGKYQSFLIIFWMIGYVASYFVGVLLPDLGENS